MGKIIVIEGTDCSGKETQSKMLVEKLKEKGYKVKRMSFPMYESPTGKIVGGAYLGKKEIGPCLFEEGAVNVDPEVASLYYAADRRYHLDMLLKLKEENDYLILARYISSNMAHQGSKIVDDEKRYHIYQFIDKLEYWLLSLPKPDCTIFLHMPTEYAKKLKQNRENIDEHEKNEAYLQQSEKAYIELSEMYNWKTIECVRENEIRTIEDINDELLKIFD